MAVTLLGNTGPSTAQDGQNTGAPRFGRDSGLAVVELHGKYYEQTARGNVFIATAASAALQANAATSMAPIGLYNPVGSGKNISLLRVELAFTVLPGTQAAGAVALYVQNTVQSAAPSSVTAGTAINALLGSNAAPACKVYTAGTLAAAPSLAYQFGGKVGTSNATATVFPGVPTLTRDFDGMLVLAPGSALVVQETTADTTSNYSAGITYVWEEVPQ